MPPLLRRWTVFVLLAFCTLIALNHIANLKTWPQTSDPPFPNGPYQAQFATPKPQSPPAQLPLEIPDDGKVHWETIAPHFPVETMIPYPKGPDKKIPRIQHDFSKSIETGAHRAQRKTRLAAVKEAFEHSWNGYRNNAWLHDEVKPISGEANDPFGGWGATLVDSLDTLWIMGMEKDFAEAVAALDNIDFGQCALKDVNIFETTIRYLGGFLSAYDLSGSKYPMLKKKAVEVAELMYRAFDTPNRMPITRWDWQKYLDGEVQKTPSLEIVAELGSLTLEFTHLTQITGDPKWFDAVQRITDRFELEQNRTLIPGLWPLTVNPAGDDAWTDTTFTIGGMADSVFEYLPKEYLLLGGRSPSYGHMHMSVARAAKEYLVFEPLLPPPDSSGSDTIPQKSPLVLGTTRLSNRRNPKLDPRGEHLTCFAGGMLALGARALSDIRPASETAEDLEVGRRLAEGCIWSYSATVTGIGPEIFSLDPCRKGRDAVTGGREADYEGNRGDCAWERKRWLSSVKARGINRKTGATDEFVEERHLGGGFTDISDSKYILRPEAIESLFVLYRITGDEALQDAAWTMFSNIVKHTRTDIAFAAIPNVNNANGKGDMYDSMESFWTAETLKYFYLIFAEPSVVDLDQWVLNTEAHPFRWRNGARV